jgi:hypothetical protein
MPAHLICFVAFAILIPVFGVLQVRAALLWQDILDKVNEKRSPEERSAPLFWHAGTVFDLISDYRRLCPGGPLVRRYLLLVGFSFSLFLIAVATLVLCSRA